MCNSTAHFGSACNHSCGIKQNRTDEAAVQQSGLAANLSFVRRRLGLSRSAGQTYAETDFSIGFALRSGVRGSTLRTCGHFTLLTALRKAPSLDDDEH